MSDWKKMWCFHFFRKFVPILHNGSHIIIKNHSEFRLFFLMEDETRELPHHNKQPWLHHARPIKFHTAAKPGVKRKCDNDALNKNNEKYEANRKRLFLSSWDTDRHWLQNDHEKGMTCKMCVEHYRDTLNLQGSSKNIFSSQVPKIIKSVQYLTMRNLVCILMQLE